MIRHLLARATLLTVTICYVASYLQSGALLSPAPPGDPFSVIRQRQEATAHTTRPGNPYKDRDPLPCIRRYEGTYADGRGKYRSAYQFDRSAWNSVSNARQRRLFDRIGDRRNWHEQDENAWELYRAHGLRKWGNAVRRNCRPTRVRRA